MAYLDEYLAGNPGVSVKYLDIFNNTENREVFEQFKKDYNLKFTSVPVIFIGNAVLEGENAIRTNFEPLVIWYKKNETPAYSLPQLPVNTFSATDESGEISIPLIIFAGLLDGINPCAFAVLVFLLVYLMTLTSRKRMILAGIIYSSAVFIFYFLSGLGLFTIIQTTGMVKGFSFIAAAIAIIAGILMIKDAFFPGKGPSLAIPESRKSTINRFVEKSSIPAAFILGILVGMFELPCTGGIYLAIISMISLRMNIYAGIGYLLLYNVAFIIPLLIILGLVAWGMPPERVNEFRIEQRRLIRLIIGLIMFFFAALILMELF